MMTQEYNKYKLYCDCCDNCLEFDSFEEAVAYKKKEGWGSVNYDGEWEDYCPECLGNTRK